MTTAGTVQPAKTGEHTSGAIGCRISLVVSSKADSQRSACTTRFEALFPLEQGVSWALAVAPLALTAPP